MVMMLLGDYDSAITTYQEALAIGETAGNLDAQAISHSMINFAYIDRAEYGNAIRVLESGIALGEQVGNVTALVSRGNLGAVYAELGQPERGLEIAQQGYQIAAAKFTFLLGWPLLGVLRIQMLRGDTIAAEESMAKIGS